MNIHPLNKLLFAVLASTCFAGFSATANSQAQSKHHAAQEKTDARDAKDKHEQKKSGVPQAQADQAKGPPRIVQVQQEAQVEKEQHKSIPAQHKQQGSKITNKEGEKLSSKNSSKQRRLPEQQQRVLIQQQQQRVSKYRQNVAQRQTGSRQQGLQLQQQKRMSQYRYQQQYYERMRQQQIGYQNDRYDYNNDPYFYTESIYRYNRGGRYYQTNQYGANILRQALNYGYQEGMRAGRADQEDNWRYSYRDSYIYDDANYGYNGYYVQQDDYNYYFRQGFQRGYEDGYYGRRKYGRSYNGSDSLLSAVLITVLGLQSIR